MFKTLLAVALCSVAMPIAPVFAQQTLVVGGASDKVLRAGTTVAVRTRTELTTKDKVLRVGQRFDIETAEAVALDGHVVIPVGTPGVGEITSVRNKGMWGKSGHFDLQLLYLRVGDRQIRVTGKADDKGKAGGAGAVAVSALIFLPAGFFMTGTSARLPAGSNILATLAEDVPVAFAAPAVAPMVVAAEMPVTVGTVPVAKLIPVSAPGEVLLKVSAPK